MCNTMHHTQLAKDFGALIVSSLQWPILLYFYHIFCLRGSFWDGMDSLSRASSNQKEKCLGEEAWPQSVPEHQTPAYKLIFSIFNNNVHFTEYPVYNMLNLIYYMQLLTIAKQYLNIQS